MNTKFTEGNWESDYYNVVSNGRVVAECGFSANDYDKEEIANAHLITTAPDMYAMLEMLVNGDSINDHSIEKEVISLLTKARGEL
jgi:hypothetical protein